MGNIVNSSAAAAAIGALHLDELQTRNCLQQLSRLGAHTLAMGQVARVLIGHSHCQRRQFADETELGEELAGVFDPAAKIFSLFGVSGIVLQQMAIFLHGRAAAGRVDYNCIDAGLKKQVDIAWAISLAATASPLCVEAPQQVGLRGIPRRSRCAVRRAGRAIAEQDRHDAAVHMAIWRASAARETGCPWA